MATLSTGKIAELILENALPTFESQQMMLDKVSVFTPGAGTMQLSGNFIWRNVQQHAPVISGWDLSGQETGIIQETYPAVLGTPTNDYVELRIDDMRDEIFWQDRGKQSGMRQASYLNSSIASAMALQGSLYVRSNTTSGYNFVSAGQTVQNERQSPKGQRYFMLNDRDNNFFSQDLAGRQTLQGRPADTWNTGQIGQNVAEYDVYVGSFLPNLTGGQSPNATVTGTQSFAPEGGTVDPSTGVVTNVDYRSATIPISNATLYNVGDKIGFSNSGIDVFAVGLDDKVNTNVQMTFTIVAKSGNNITIYPKPIALNDPALDTVELAYANINTRILNGAVVERLNLGSSQKTNLFWNKDAVEVLGGTIPAELFKQFSGKKVIYETMKNGLTMYVIYDSNISTMAVKFRIFTWWGFTVRNPQAVGVANRYQAS